MKQRTGSFTLPAETGMEVEIRRLADLWGADAVRDSDGTVLSQEIIDMGFKVYSTLCLVREDNEWAKANRDCLQQMYLMSRPVTATGGNLDINIMETYFAEQFAPDAGHDISRFWQVIDRTSGTTVSPEKWSYNEKNCSVTIQAAEAWHVYTVSFLAWQIWEPTSMYNHITNHWTTEHKLPVDVRIPKARAHMLEYLEQWLKEHTQTDVVRFTTFFYQFDLVYNNEGKEKRVDWFGCGGSVSVWALNKFEEEYGYRLFPEDFTDSGYYNTPFKNPSKKHLDWMEFNQKFVASAAKEWVDLVHAYNKKAIMFLGDHWAGTEPYGKYFQSIGLDAVVGAAGDGVTTRMIADIPVKETEARFYPYFFPDIFHTGGDPVGASLPVWRKCRRALMRKPIARMGYGGYLSLASQFPEFIDHVTDICRQFRAINEKSAGVRPYTAPFRVAVLNSWGHLRAWQTHQVAHSLWNQRCYSYLGIIETLAGFPFEVEFISFDDIREKGIDPAIGVIINAGDAGTSWCGGDNWKDPAAVSALRSWTAAGGGFIGAGEPTSFEYGGRFFQLSDILGVQKEIGYTVNTNKKEPVVNRDHFICRDMDIHVDGSSSIDYGEGSSMIYAEDPDTRILDTANRSITLAAHTFRKGRAVYMAGLPYTAQNARLLLRSIFWAAAKEDELYRWFSTNPDVECHAYPGSGWFAAVNNAEAAAETDIVRLDGSVQRITISAMDTQWFKI